MRRRRHRSSRPRQDLPAGRRRGARAARRQPHDRARRVRRDHGRVGLGQVDADEHPRLPRPPDQRHATCSRASTSRRSTSRRWRASAAGASASSSRASTCSRAPARSRTSSCRCSTPAWTARTSERRARAALQLLGLDGPRAQPAEPALGRPAAARRDRARAGQRPGDPAGRRADRQSRLADRGRDHGRSSGALNRERGLTVVLVTHEPDIAALRRSRDHVARRR